MVIFYNNAGDVCCVKCVEDDISAIPNGHDMAGGDADSAAVNDGSSQLHDDGTTKNDKADAEKAGESGDELVVIQDTGFNINIVAPGVDPFDLPVCNIQFLNIKQL